MVWPIDRNAFVRLARPLVAVAALAVGLSTIAAEARPPVCRQIEAQLAALPAGGGRSSGQALRYERAIATQQQQMARAREQARGAGCDRGLFARAGACGAIGATLQRMEANLADLQRQHARLSGGGDTRGERARLTAAHRANGCRSPASAAAPSEAESRGRVTINQPARNLSGNFRTLCVRTCDGYYFPISYAVSSSTFERDEKACAAMCPGARTELHYHRIPGQEADDMVSASTGLAYRDLPAAFLHRQTAAQRPEGCGCETNSAGGGRGFEVIAGGSYRDETETAAIEPQIPQPWSRPDPAEDPETLANREGGLDLEAMRRLTARPTPPPTATGQPDDPAERRVRVVGPVFFPDPEAATVPQAQAPIRAP